MRQTLVHLAASAALMLGAFVAPLQAGIFTAGNTHPAADDPFSIPNPDVNAIINFAVYINDGSGWNSTVPGTGDLTATFNGGVGSPVTGLDNTATYLYLYQVANVGPNAIDQIHINNATTANGLTSWGYFGSLGFFYDTGLVPPGALVSTSHSIGPAGTAAPAGDPSAFVLGGDPLSVVNNASAIIPNDGANNPVEVIGGFRVHFSGTLIGGSTSVLFGYTSTNAPFIGTANVDDGVDPDGTVPVSFPGLQEFPPLPEPGSMLVWGLGMSLVAAGGYWRRRKVVA